MIDKRYTITSDATEGIELLLTQFERDRDLGPVDLVRYTPPRDDPAYDAVVTELARIDLEHGFNEGGAADAAPYIERFPRVFEDSHQRTQLAFEEYRLRRRGGEDVTGCEIGDKYDVDGTHWPSMKLGSDEATPSRQFSRRFSERDLSPPMVHYPTVGETFAGYRLVTRIGEGAFSRVFLARQPDLASRLVVLKVTPLSTDESDRLASLQHSSIIPVYSVHREGDLSCICMPFLGATTLADLSASGERWASLDGPADELVSTILERRKSTIRTLNLASAGRSQVRNETESVEVEEFVNKSEIGDPDSKTPATELAQYSNLGYVDALLELVTGAVEGLAHAHRRGIIHRDLKPANILVTDDGSPVLLDFNLAVSSQEPRTRVVGGTLPYMSPQQLETLQPRRTVVQDSKDSRRTVVQDRENGYSAADTRDDVFSIGVVLYELLSGHLPFSCPKSGEGFELASLVAERRRVPKSIGGLNTRVSPGLESIIDRCVAPEREQRYLDATELLEDLRRHRQHLPLKFAPNRSLGERMAKWSARHPRLSSASSVATFAAALLLLCSMLIWQRGERIARLDVESQYQQLQHELPRAITALSTPGYELELLSSGLEQSSRLMNQWHVDSGRWQELSDVDRLDPKSQQTLRSQLAKLAFSMANAEFHRSRQSDVPQRDRLAEKAQYWNRLAGELDPKLGPLAKFQRRKLTLKRDGETKDEDVVPSSATITDVDLRALWAAESGDFVLWRELTEQQLDEQPTNVTHWTNLAIANGRLGNMDAAAANFDVSNRLQPNSISTLLNRGVCQLGRGEPQLALHDFSACLQLNPRLMVPRFNRALAAHRLGDNQAALEDLNMLVRSGHAATRIVLMRAQVHEALGNLAAAESDRRTAMEIAPRDAKDWVARGVARAAESPNEALADFKAALRIRPDDEHAIRSAAHVYAERLDQAEPAIELLTRLIAIRPQSALPVASRGILHARLGNIRSALADASAAVALSPGGREQLQIAGIHAMVSEQLDRDAQQTKALTWLARALRTDVGLARVARADADLANLRGDRRFSQLVGTAMKIDAQSAINAKEK